MIMEHGWYIQHLLQDRDTCTGCMRKHMELMYATNAIFSTQVVDQKWRIPLLGGECLTVTKYYKSQVCNDYDTIIH